MTIYFPQQINHVGLTSKNQGLKRKQNPVNKKEKKINASCLCLQKIDKSIKTEKDTHKKIFHYSKLT